MRSQLTGEGLHCETSRMTISSHLMPNARKEAGHQLNRVQVGLDPDDWKPFDVVGAGTKEIRINLDDGWFRVMYVAKFPEAVYVLHCFKKKTSATSKQDKDITATRYKAVIQERSKP